MWSARLDQSLPYHVQTPHYAQPFYALLLVLRPLIYYASTEALLVDTFLTLLYIRTKKAVEGEGIVA